MNKVNLLVLIAVFSVLITGCQNEAVILVEANTPAEVANQLGAIMATVDEAGRGTVTIASYQNQSLLQKIEARPTMAQLLIPQALAASCNTAEFSTCSSNSVTRNFNSCTNGSYVLTGSVAMTWTGGSACAMTGTSQAIQITPNYTAAGNNVSVSETKNGAVGVTLTWTSGAGAAKVFSYVNDGVNRSVRYNGSTLLSLNTRTVTALTVTGTDRGNRILSGAAGAIEITNATTSEVCTLRPSTVSWAATNCNCATSGQFTGSCTSMGNYAMTITGCGVATLVYTENGATATQSVSLDRCVQN